MSLTEGAIQKIEDLVKPVTVEVEGRPYSTESLSPVVEPTAKSININTLNGFADYIENCIDSANIDLSKCMIHIIDHENVSLVGPIFGKFRQREVFVTVQSLTDNCFNFGQPYDLERFIIAIQANFFRTDAVESLLKLVSSISSEAKVKRDDDGISQSTTIKSGIHLVQEAKIPNPITLQPYRTFLDIVQPESSYVFRLSEKHGSLTCILHESGGGQWKLEAIKRIREWFEEQKDAGRIPGEMTIIS